MSSKLKCVFCAKIKDDEVRLFSEDTLKKCRFILRQRKLYKLKYQNTVLRNDIYESGYHSSCYSSFIALKKNFFETSKNIDLSNNQQSTSASHSTTDNISNTSNHVVASAT